MTLPAALPVGGPSGRLCQAGNGGAGDDPLQPSGASGMAVWYLSVEPESQKKIEESYKN